MLLKCCSGPRVAVVMKVYVVLINVLCDLNPMTLNRKGEWREGDTKAFTPS